MKRLYKFFILVLISIENIALVQKCPAHQLCIPIDHCSSINSKLYQVNLTDSEIGYLKSLQCDYFDDKVHICCNSSLPQPGKCGRLKFTDKITNGRQAYLGQYPWAVLIGRRWKEANNRTGISFECGGALINDRHVVTAAHCVKFLNYTIYKEQIKTIEIARLGEWNTKTDPDEDLNTIGEPVVEAVVEKIIPHKKYRPTKKYNDIALLRLKEKVNFTKFIYPICLPHEQEEYFDDLTIVGWGKTNASHNDLEEIQRFATVNLIDNNECDEIYDNYKIKSTQICAGSFGKDSCAGDSGGPLIGLNTTHKIFYFYLAGIVSFGRKNCGTIGQPGIYTDVRKYVDWIQQNVIH